MVSFPEEYLVLFGSGFPVPGANPGLSMSMRGSHGTSIHQERQTCGGLLPVLGQELEAGAFLRLDLQSSFCVQHRPQQLQLLGGWRESNGDGCEGESEQRVSKHEKPPSYLFKAFLLLSKQEHRTDRNNKSTQEHQKISFGVHPLIFAFGTFGNSSP